MSTDTKEKESANMSTDTMETAAMSTSISTAAPNPPEMEEVQESKTEETDDSPHEEDDDYEDDYETPVPRRSAPPRRGLERQSGQRQSLMNINMQVPRKMRHWPRTFACCFGVFIPLNCIVCVSLVVGLLFGSVEMHEEIQSNDAVIRAQMADEKYANDLDIVFVDKLPTLCLSMFHKQVPKWNLSNVFETIMTNQSLVEPYMTVDNAPNTSNVQEMAQFFAACGTAGGLFRDRWMSMFQPESDPDATSLTFNYVRCVNRSSPLAFNAIIFPRENDMYEALPSTQANLYLESWKKNQQALEAEYLNELNYTELEALTQSYADATGKEKCAVNMPSAAWFWFTVMSTVGYGNQVPKTVGGRTLTYTLGFASILLFGGVLATAGGITTHLMNDAVHRCKHRVAKPTMIFLWFCLWCLWMLVISHQAKSFEETRLQEEFPLNDAYWFAFISTTTVGFGDYYLQPEGLFVSDLLGLWGNFLIGFVLLSSFITELSQYLSRIVPDLAADLQQKLKYAYDQEEVPEEILRKSQQKKDPRIRKQLMQEMDNSVRPTDWCHPVLRNTHDNPSQQPTQRSRTAEVAMPTILSDDSATSPSATAQEEAERQRQAMLEQEAERQRQAILQKEAERQRQAELQRKKTVEQQQQDAKQQRQSILQQEAERQKQAILQKEAERQRQIELQRKQEQEQAAERRKQLQQQHQEAQRKRQAELQHAAEQRRQSILQQEAERQRQEDVQRKHQQQQQEGERQRQSALQRKQQQKRQQEQEAERVRQAELQRKQQQEQQQRQQEEQRRQQQAKQQEEAKKKQQAAPVTPLTTVFPPQQQMVAIFVNRGIDPAMAKAELYYESTRWGPLGHGDAAITVSTNTGAKWYIVANGVYAKLFTIGESPHQRFNI